MKRLLSFLLPLLLLLGCSAPREKDTQVLVFAAASLEETLTEIGSQYMTLHEDVELIFNFDSSGTLLTQIEEGAACDLFLSAGQKQINALSEPPVDRIDLLENKVVLAVPEGNPAGVTSFASLKEKLEAGSILLAMGNSDVPVGQYTQNILSWLSLEEEQLSQKGQITYGSNAKEITLQVAEGTVSCGVLYATDACSAGLTVVDTATEEMCGQVIYPAAVLTQSEAALSFFEYLQSQEADAVFSSVGFTPLG